MTSVTPDSGKIMRPIDGFYMYNLSTKGITPALYKLRITDNKASATLPATFGPTLIQAFAIKM